MISGYPFYKGCNVLVTGGLGFIGSCLAEKLVTLGASVTVLDNMEPNFGGNYHNISQFKHLIKVFNADLRCLTDIEPLIKQHEVVFHLAGQVSHGDSMREPLNDLEVNALATLNLVESLRKHNPSARVVYTSTRQVYGIPRTVPVDEDHPVSPIDVNGIHKLSGEFYHRLYYENYGLKSTILRLTNTYGPRLQIKNDRQGFISVFLNRVLRGKPITIFGDGSQIRDFNYVDDVVEALILAPTIDLCFGKTFNLGTTERYSLRQFVDIIQSILPADVEFEDWTPDKKLIDIGDYYGDFSKFSGLSGWKPKTNVRDGLEKTLDYFKKNINYYL